MYIKQRRRVIAGPSSFQRRNPTKANLAKIKAFNERVNGTNRIVLGHVVVKHGREKCALPPVNPFHKARHPSLPPADSKKNHSSRATFHTAWVQERHFAPPKAASLSPIAKLPGLLDLLGS